MWRFYELSEGMPERAPREAEFFNLDNLSYSDSLVRESIQNSLDARVIESDPVKVVYRFGSISIDHAGQYLDGLKEHLEGCGLLTSCLTDICTMPFLLIEDFGTTGLDGLINRSDITEHTKSNYYNFWWREGISKKEGYAVGRWGLGKTVYHVCSSLRSFWGLTTRYDDKRTLLYGKSLFPKTHRCDGKVYDYSAYYTSREGYSPIEQEELVDEFKSLFKLSRLKEPGLSIVIPAISDEITPTEIIKSLIIHYFYPIMKRGLIVEIISDEETIVLDDSSLREHALKLEWDDTAWKSRSVEPLMTFLEDVATCPSHKVVDLTGAAEHDNRISEELFGDKLSEAMTLYEESKLLMIKAPVVIEPSGKDPIISYFEIYLQKDDLLKDPDEFYIRSGITISEISLIKQNVRALLSVEEEPVSRFLGDAESPAHTNWKEKTEGFRDKYNNAVRTLRYIKNSMKLIVGILETPPPGLDKEFLDDIFYKTTPIDEGKGTVTKKPEIPETLVKRKFSIRPKKGGFSVILINKEVELPIKIQLMAAYDTKESNPFKAYHIFDFNFEDGAIEKEISGGLVCLASKNVLNILVQDHDFKIEVTGFDEKRDVIVDIQEM